MIQAQYIHSDKCLYDGLEYDSEFSLSRYLISQGMCPRTVIWFYRGDKPGLAGSLSTLAKLDLVTGDDYEVEVTKWVPKGSRKGWSKEFKDWWGLALRGKV